MTTRSAAKVGSCLMSRALVPFAILLLAATSRAPYLADPGPAPTPETPKRNIAGPGDYALREKMVHLIGRDPELAQEKFNVIMVNGGAVFSGEIRNWTLKKRALTIAATMRGVVNVTDEVTVPRGEVTDAALAKAVMSLLGDAAADLDLKNLDVQVEDGVLTMTGTVRDIAARSKSEDIAGTVLGVTRISNRLEPADAPSGSDDATLLKAVLAYLENFRAFGYPSDITVKVEQGIVTLKGKVALYTGRQRAALAASLVKGVARVDNRIKVDPTVLPRAIRVQAEK